MGQNDWVPKKNGLVKGKIDQNLWFSRVGILTHSHLINFGNPPKTSSKVPFSGMKTSTLRF